MADCFRQVAEIWSKNSASVLTLGNYGLEQLEIDYETGRRIGRPLVERRVRIVGWREIITTFETGVCRGTAGWCANDSSVISWSGRRPFQNSRLVCLTSKGKSSF